MGAQGQAQEAGSLTTGVRCGWQQGRGRRQGVPTGARLMVSAAVRAA